ncbi:hypothetical protein SVIO_064860 [Streptomyces violaceusniger]|uniref:Uncharacterized protein n=1 Tax=Streptomyces violaceusniger TaxID=68280 RepID=A0A4D4LCQ6_STRVO|nr:hypothetical protein SVIO_064860 [Streptomyces violaceusniger]
MLLPPGVVTRTFTGPAGPDGAMAVAQVSETTVKEAGVEPKSTELVVVRPLPKSVTVVPVPSGPSIGDRPVRTGWGHTEGLKGGPT